MSIQRQGSKQGSNFSFSLSDEALENVLPRKDRAVPPAQNEDQGNIAALVSTSDDENEAVLSSAASTQLNAALSEFAEADPTSFDGMSEKQRRNRNSDLNIGGVSGAMYTEDNNPWGETKEERKNKQSAEALEGMVEASEERRKKEWDELRERQWADMMKNDFGINLTPEEWDAASANLKDPKKRAATLKKVQQEKGLTDQQAQNAGTMADRIFAIKENDQLSPQQQKDQLDNLRRQSPADFDNGLAVVKQSAKNGVDRDYGATVGTTKDARAENQGASLDARDDMLAAADAEVPVQSAAASTATPTTKSAATQNFQDEKLFASAPPAGEHFAVAASGVPATPAAPKVAPAATMAAAVKPDALVC